MNIENLNQPPKSARAVTKVLEQFGIKEIELWKNTRIKHYVFSGNHPDFQLTGGETIFRYDLKLSDYTLLEWLGEFFHKAHMSDWHESWVYKNEIVNPVYDKLSNFLHEHKYFAEKS